MKKLRIGIPLIGGQSWHGGITYIESILKAFHALPFEERPSLHFFITYDQIQQLKLFQKLFYLMDERIVIGGEIGHQELSELQLTRIDSFDEILSFVDFIFPVNSSSLPGTPHAVWIPDLQHKELKELFSNDDYSLRDQKIASALEGRETIVVSSQSTRINFKQYFPEYTDRVEVIHFYSNFESNILKESPLPVVEKYNLPKNFIICCNQFWQHKNHDTLFKALSLTQEPIHLVCTGAQVDYRNQEWFAKLDVIVKDNNLSDRISFLGFIPREDQIQLMRQSLAVIQPSLFEGWSTVMEDARALSKTVLASNIDVHVEQNLLKARYFEKNSPEQLASLIDKVVHMELPGANLVEEELSAKEISTLQEIAARNLMNIAWSTTRRFDNDRQDPLLNGKLSKQLIETAEKMRLQSDTEYFEYLVRSGEGRISSLHNELLALNEVLKIRQNRIEELAPKVHSQSDFYLTQEQQIKKLDLKRQFFDVILSIQKPKTFLAHCKSFASNYALPLLIKKIKYQYFRLSLSVKNSVFVGARKFNLNLAGILGKVSSLFQKLNINQHETRIEGDDKLSNLQKQASEKKYLIENIDTIIKHTQEDIAGKEAEIKYNESTLDNLLLGSREKEEVIASLELHIQWQISELGNLFKPKTFFKKCYRYILIRVESKFLYKVIYPARRGMKSLMTEIKARLNWVIGRAHHLLNYFRPSKAPIELGVLFQHPPKKNLILSSPTKGSLGKYQISLVTPSFEQDRYIERTILSVQAQGYPKLEYLIQDGGSSDSTKEIISRYSSIVSKFESKDDKGQSQAINLAFKKSTGDIMGWLNSDDMLVPGALDLVAQYFEKNPNIDVVYGNRIIINSDDQKIGKWLLPEHDNNVLLWADFIPQETMFWRREIWEKSGASIDEEFQFAMDWELLLRFRDSGARFKRIPAFLGYFRVHSSQKTSREINTQGAHEMNVLRKKYLGKIPSEEEIYLAILPYLKKHQLENFRYTLKEKFGLV